MDEIDVHIIQRLHTDGRLSQEQIARDVNLSRPAVHERIRRLEKQGVIQGYQALVDWAVMGLPMTAFVSVRTAGVMCSSTTTALLALSDATAMVAECHRVTGEWCMLLQVRAASPLALQDLLDRIRAVPGVTATMTNLVLSSLSARDQTRSDR